MQFLGALRDKREYFYFHVRRFCHNYKKMERITTMSWSHLIVFVLGAVAGAGVTYSISLRLSCRGGVTQRDIRAGGDVVGGNKVGRDGRK